MVNSGTNDERLLKLQYRLAQIEKKERSHEDFLVFVKAVWPEFIAGNHHKIIADKLQRVASGDLKRLIINMPPRHTKSEFASFLFPAWMIGKNPNMKIIQATHTTELAVLISSSNLLIFFRKLQRKSLLVLFTPSQGFYRFWLRF